MGKFSDTTDEQWPPPIILPTVRNCIWISASGEVEEISIEQGAQRSQEIVPLLCHGPATVRRLKCAYFANLDVLELFAFVRPAQFCLPNPRGLCEKLKLDLPTDQISAALSIRYAAETLLEEIKKETQEALAISIARVMNHSGWQWGTMVLDALNSDNIHKQNFGQRGNLSIWLELNEWTEAGRQSPSGNQEVTSQEARQRLSQLTGKQAEARPGQANYASAATAAFSPRQVPEQPRVVLAEAGTGVGKTLGYIAPASLWSEKNKGTVWISTHTRNLQHQIDREFDRLYPDSIKKAHEVVIRKGRENYACLLNFEEATRNIKPKHQNSIGLGLIARWLLKTRDGDMTGGDFPSWLSDLLGQGLTLRLTDRRGECIYSACSHYHKCFIEKSVRMARRASSVIANHSLVILQAALADIEDSNFPVRYVFDEGHHLLNAADKAFSTHLSGIEGAEMRRWLIGTTNQHGRNIKGLKTRVNDLIRDDIVAIETQDQIFSAARILPMDGWLNRLRDDKPSGSMEVFLNFIRSQIYGRNRDIASVYSLETHVQSRIPGFDQAISNFGIDLDALIKPMHKLTEILRTKLVAQANNMDANTRVRTEAIIKSLQYRGQSIIGTWKAMVESLNKTTPPEFLDWFQIERNDGMDVDIGMRRHWIDPTIPLHNTVFRSAHGLLITSATLRDTSGNTEEDWKIAESRTGACHLAKPAIRAAVISTFDYFKQTRVYIVNDLQKNDIFRLASAYRELFIASEGGALGLFTAIHRLRAVYKLVAEDLEQAGLTLYAQHVDGLDLATLIDIFRAEENACLFGTDAVRDGVDVPGRSLRLISFDRVPWPRPNLLYKARRKSFGGNAYADMLTRFKLKQAFGRLVRSAEDRGVFVLLDRMVPTRLLTAFPKDVPIKRCGLAAAIEESRQFLSD